MHGHWIPVRGAALVLSVLCLLLFQTGIYAYATNGIEFSSIVPRLFYYGFWATCGLATATVAFPDRSLLPEMAPLYLVLLAIAVLATIHPPIGVASRSLIMLAIVVSILLSLLVGAASLLPFRISAILSCVAAVALLTEMYFPGTFSTTVGRSAGLLQNPNVAGSALVLSGTGAFPFVLRKWKGAYAVVTTAGVLATVSRTSLLVLSVAAALSASIWLWRNRRKPLRLERGEIARTAAAALVCFGLIGFAFKINEVVSTAATNSASTALTAIASLNEVETFGGGNIDSPPATEAEKQREAEVRKAKAMEVAETLGDVDSGAARIILMTNALQEMTLLGQGAERAHELAPHNQYLFFAVAYGLAGIALAVALAGVVVWLSRSNPLFALAFVGIMAFTHDLTVLAIAIPVAVGCAGGVVLRKQRLEPIIA
ncbi:hypothetical protein VW35_15820 [Devosia soli]|uniref:Uncharacterized protein n=1 Tax=Devosia soli TaxID=361041 RepID=A0A0F5L406_9HYPH|nr:hypothetical protein [Devosia soli]KKB76960.1 hypothetical protein VW35_15820 [Devosia soli]